MLATFWGRLEEAMNGDLRVGTWLVQPGLNTISRNGTTRQLEPKVMEVLVCLAHHPGETLPKEQLLKTVWSDTFVSDDVLVRSISELRRAFEDDPRESKFIQTISKRGYRLVARVVPVNGTVSLAADEAKQSIFARRSLRIGVVVGVTTTALLLALLALMPAETWRSLGGRREVPQIRSLAVLPLQNVSGGPAQEYFVDGMTDALITELAMFGSLKVASRTSTTRYKGAKKSVPEIARELSVDGIIEGAVQSFGDRVHVTARLTYGASNTQLWANSYERDLRDIYALEREMVEDIGRHIQAGLTTQSGTEKARLLPMDPKALEAYLQGNYHLNKQGKGLGDEEKRKAAEYFQQAIAADPNFAPAYHGLTLAHELLWLGSSEDVMVARRTGEKAVEIDPNYSAGRVNLAFLKWQPDLDWRGAEQDLRHAMTLNPDNQFAHSALCILLVNLGHADEGLQECRIAQRLDPFDDDSALGLYLGRDYDGSIAMLRGMLQGDPEVGLWRCNLFPNYAMKAMYKESIQELAQCYSLYGQPKAAANIQRAFTTSGYRGAIRQWAQEMERLQASHQAFLPGSLAEAYAILGDKDRAFYWLDQAYKHREMVSFDGGVFLLGAEPLYDPLRSDPRFKELVRRVGLPQ
jgi:TolB-like protein/DNA-binding winged helix-turn-helix (wHTH) protein